MKNEKKQMKKTTQIKVEYQKKDSETRPGFI